MKSAKKKKLLIQGSTGSIGRSTLAVIREQANSFEIAGLSANSRYQELLDQCREFQPDSIALEDSTYSEGVQAAAQMLGVRNIFIGEGAARRQAAETEYHLLVNAMSGNAGMRPTLTAIERGISVALANKETLVSAGPVIMKAAELSGASIIPIDSEHSAVFQCLIGERRDRVRRIWLTTSGGPFWGKQSNQLEHVTPEQALDHPRWKMGPKITIDSATLLNKGLEVIETQRLFGIPIEQIEVIRHREHLIHSLVEFVDGSFKAQLSLPDMKLPILYALTYPDRVESKLVETDLRKITTMHFDPVETKEYPCLALAYRAIEKNGTAPAALCAADEIAVSAFLNHEIRFNDIAVVIRTVLDAWPDEPLTTLEQVCSADRRARAHARQIISSIRTAKETTCC